MNLTYNELHHSIKNLRSLFINNDVWKFGKVQKIFSSGKVLVLNVRLPGKTVYITLGRGGEYTGIWSLEKNVPSPFRIVRDKLLEYCRSSIKGKSIVDIVMDEKDKCIRLEFHDKSNALFFWKGRSLHFSYIFKEDNQTFEFSPWKSLKKEVFEGGSDLFSVFDEAGRMELEAKKANIRDLELDFEKLFSSSLVKKKKSKSERKVEKIKEDLRRCSLAGEIQELLINDELDLSQEKLKYKTFKVKFDRTDDYYKRKDRVFFKIKKLKVGAKFLEQRLKEVEQDIARKGEELVDQKIFYPIWVKIEKKSQKKAKEVSGVKYFEFLDVKLALGLTAQANDEIRKNWASKSDIWFHLEDYKSAHIIAKCPSSLDPSKIQVISSILADYSNFSADKIPVIFTQVQNLKGVKKSPGKVIFKKEKHLLVDRVNWKEIISSSW